MNAYAFSLLLLLLAQCIVSLTAANTDNTNIDHNQIVGPDYKIKSLNRNSFPSNFLFGFASSAYQYEGGANVDGKGPSIWDTFTHKFPGRIRDGKNGDVADDSYNRYKDDVRLLKEIGADTYRFSFSWARILPYGKVSGGVNQKGIAYYHNLIDELLANGIQPFVTLFHWDLPQSLQDEYDGFLSPQVVNDFQDYVDLCFREYGDKVKHWITLNEPWTYSTTMYTVGIYSSSKCLQSKPDDCKIDSATEPYIVAHNQLLAHAAAVQTYKTKYQASQKGVIGIVLISNWYVPYSPAKLDRNAAFTALDFMLGWFMDPITYGDYPSTMRSALGLRLPEFSQEQSNLLKGSYDFLGLNYYSSNYVAYAPSLETVNGGTNSTYQRNGVPIGPMAASGWLYAYPRGIYDLLIHIKTKYGDPSIYITENGWDETIDASLPLEKALADSMRIQYHHSHLAFLQRAIRDAVKVKGYFGWSLLDNFEWLDGYTYRFGIHYVDYENGQTRYPKNSATWFKNFLYRKTSN